MAFNFNWSPLNTSSATSSAFYIHAKSLLTTALNKSSKPPIIVDDIFVDDLNLGESAPDLEILEIGDIAEDRFRGIFRMNYAGDAFLTLRTKVQANPLNTYLSTSPAFTSPEPLSASSPLTIPVQITLSSFKLSGFIILVFSKAKGITLVFRNDPLESLKVSSTFDSIPFIADYLQKEIERQVRRIFQEDLPVAVHRLSLRLWNPEYAASLGMENTAPSRPMSPDDKSTPADNCCEDEYEYDVDDERLANTEAEEAFSEKNIEHLSSLLESQNTLSLVTPKLQDVVFRAWASGTGLALWDRPGALDILMPGSTRSSDSALGDDDARSISSAGPSLYSTNSSMSVGSSTTAMQGRQTPGRRKKKHRIVNLRKPPAPKLPVETPEPIEEEKEGMSAVVLDEYVEPPMELGRTREDSIDYDSRPGSLRAPSPSHDPFVQPQTVAPAPPPPAAVELPVTPARPPPLVSAEKEKEFLADLSRAQSSPIVEDPRIRMPGGGAAGSILEQAFVKKVVGELRLRLKEERERGEMGMDMAGERLRAEKGLMWCVERELQEIEGADEGLPAYGA